MLVTLKKINPLDQYQNQQNFTMFANAINSSETRKSYTYGLEKFTMFSKIERYDALASWDSYTIQNHLEQYVLECKRIDYKNTGIRIRLSGPELFLEMNRKTYYKKILHKMLPIAGHIND